MRKLRNAMKDFFAISAILVDSQTNKYLMFLYYSQHPHFADMKPIEMIISTLFLTFPPG